MAFDAKYHFKRDNIVVIEHIHDGSLRVVPHNNDCASDGQRGEKAQWKVKLLGDDKIRLKSMATGKFLRIRPNNDIDVCGRKKGPATIFKVHMVNEPNVVKLESNKLGGKYIAVKPNGKVKPGNGGKHCKLTFYRNTGGGGGGGGGDDAPAADDGDDDKQAESSDSDSGSDVDNYDPEKDKDEEDVKIPEPPAPVELGEDAKAVKAWLETIGQGEYLDTFVEAGYDKMGTVSMIDEDDLEKMGVKPGHTKEIMLAARAAPFLNHWVGFRSQHKKRFLAADEGNKKKTELKDEAAKKDGLWFIEQSPNGNNLVRLRSKYNSYLRMNDAQDKHLVTIAKEKDIDGRNDLQILPCTDEKRQNVIRIWCPKNANFMTFDDNILKDRVNSHEESFEKDVLPKQQWEIIIKD